MTPAELGACLRHARGSKGWGRGQLVDKTGIPKTTIADYECGRVTPSLHALALIIEALGIKSDALFHGWPRWEVRRRHAR